MASAEAPRLPFALRLGREGVARVVRLIDRARREARYGVRLTAAHDLGYYLDADLDLHEHQPWDGCPAGIHHLGVQSDGRLKPCLALDDRYCVGSVRDRSLGALWEDETCFRPWRRFEESAMGESCRGCVWASRCRGGCAAYSTALTGALQAEVLRALEQDLRSGPALRQIDRDSPGMDRLVTSFARSLSYAYTFDREAYLRALDDYLSIYAHAHGGLDVGLFCFEDGT